MRLWSLHPKYLDAKGLVALWREALLAKNVLEGNTKGYKNHPQLVRFKESPNPVEAIHQYLAHVHQEACDRGYRFDPEKFCCKENPLNLSVTTGQLDYERVHLLNKLKIRDYERFCKFLEVNGTEVHPMFTPVAGPIEDWEKL